MRGRRSVAPVQSGPRQGVPLTARITTLLGTDLTLSDDGSVVPVAVAEPPGEQESDTPPTYPAIAAFTEWHAAGGEGEFTFPTPVTLDILRQIWVLIGKPAKPPGSTRALHAADGRRPRPLPSAVGHDRGRVLTAAGPRGRRTLRKAVAAGQVRVDLGEGGLSRARRGDGGWLGGRPPPRSHAADRGGGGVRHPGRLRPVRLGHWACGPGRRAVQGPGW